MTGLLASLWGTDMGLALVLFAIFDAAFVIGIMLFGGGARKRREASLAKRLGFRRAVEETADKPAGSHWVPSQLVAVGQRFAVATGFSESLDDRLEQAGVPLRSGEFVALTASASVAGAVFAALLVQNILFVLVIAMGAAWIPHFWVGRSRSKRQQALVDQLADTLSILAGSLRAGYSFLQALDTVSHEIGEPSAREFQRVVAEIRLGRPVDDALIALAERVQSDDLRWAVIAINVQRQVGGNLAEVLDIVANTVRERAYLRRQVRVLSAEGRISVAILAGIPFILLLYLAIVRPDYVSLLFTRTAGLAMLAFGGLLLGLGIWTMLRIVKIDV